MRDKIKTDQSKPVVLDGGDTLEGGLGRESLEKITLSWS